MYQRAHLSQDCRCGLLRLTPRFTPVSTVRGTAAGIVSQTSLVLICVLCAVSLMGSFVLTGHADGAVRCWDVSSGQRLGVVQLVARSVTITCVEAHPTDSGTYLAMARDGVIFVVDARTSKVRQVYRLVAIPTERIHALSLSGVSLQRLQHSSFNVASDFAKVECTACTSALLIRVY